MALNNAQLHQLVLDNLPDNVTQFISPELLREVCDEIIDSVFLLIDDQDFVGLSEYDENVAYPDGSATIYQDGIYQAIVGTSTTIGPFDPSEWNLLAPFSASTADFIVKDEGIELDPNKNIKLLADDTSLIGIDTGFYEVNAVSTIVGLDQEYPVAGKSWLRVMNGSSASRSLNTLIPFSTPTKIYVKNQANDWQLIDLTSSITTASNGLTKLGNDVQLGGTLVNATITGNGTSPFNVNDASIGFFNNSTGNNNFFALNNNNVELRSNNFIRLEGESNFIYGNTTQIGTDPSENLNVFSTPNLINLSQTSAFTLTSEVIMRDPSTGRLYAGSVNLFTGGTGPSTGTTVSAGPGIVVDQLVNDYTVSLAENFTGGTVDFENILSGGTDLSLLFTGGTSGGEVNTASNVGGETGLFLQKTGVDLEFKTLSAGTNVTLDNGGQVVTINAQASTPGEPNYLDLSQESTIYSLQVEDAGKTIVNASSPRFIAIDYTLTSPADVFYLKGAITVSGNSGMLIYDASGNTSSTLTLDDDVPYVLHRFPKTGFNWRVVELGGGGVQPGEANTASNVGSGSGVFARKSGVDLEFKSLIAGSNLSFVEGTDDITINAAGTSYTFANGLNESAGTVKLGGAITEPTNLSLANNSFGIVSGPGAGLQISGVSFALGDGINGLSTFDGSNYLLNSMFGNMAVGSMAGFASLNGGFASNNRVIADQDNVRFEIEQESFLTLSGSNAHFFEIAQYDQDYSTSFTDNSLVTKKYVDDNAGGGGTERSGAADTNYSILNIDGYESANQDVVYASVLEVSNDMMATGITFNIDTFTPLSRTQFAIYDENGLFIGQTTLLSGFNYSIGYNTAELESEVQLVAGTKYYVAVLENNPEALSLAKLDVISNETLSAAGLVTYTPGAMPADISSIFVPNSASTVAFQAEVIGYATGGAVTGGTEGSGVNQIVEFTTSTTVVNGDSNTTYCYFNNSATGETFTIGTNFLPVGGEAEICQMGSESVEVTQSAGITVVGVTERDTTAALSFGIRRLNDDSFGYIGQVYRIY